MPSYRAVKQPKPIECNAFLGLNEAYGDTEVRLGEAIYMRNFNITNNMKLRKREGFTRFVTGVTDKPIQGMWHGLLGASTLLIFCYNAKVYKYNMSITDTDVTLADLIANGTVVEVGSITDAPTSIFYFESKLYFFNGTDYKQYDGTTYADVTPYVPTVYINAPPTGGGTAFEQINLLTGQKKQTFVGDGVATEYTLVESGITSVDSVKVNGVTKALTTDYTVNLITGKVTFTAGSIPADEAEVEILWTKATSGHADLVKKNKYAMLHGIGNDTNIFVWGNSSFKNRLTFSGALQAGYFPVNNYINIGTDDTAITDVVTQYSRQIIFKEDRTYYSTSEYSDVLDDYVFTIRDLNEAVGNVGFNTVQVIDNSPVSLKSHSVWKWVGTSVEDERNAKVISDRVNKSLADLDLSTAVTFDNQSEKELWINIGSTVYIYNYGNDTWYVYDNISAKCFLDIDGTVYFGDGHGNIERFVGALNDNGVAIASEWDSGFIDFGAYEYKKNSRDMWLAIEPATRTSVTVKCPTNRINKEEPTLKTFTVGYTLFDFGDIDFGDWSFETNRNPQTRHIKIRSKKYTSIQFIFTNAEVDESLILLSFKVNVEIGNFV